MPHCACNRVNSHNTHWTLIGDVTAVHWQTGLMVEITVVMVSGLLSARQEGDLV